jgi:hypothetical protein
MKVLKYESFLETMQFAALTNAQKLAKQEAERRKAKQEEDPKKNIPAENIDNPKFHSDEEMEEPEGQGEMEMEEPEGQGEMDDEEY